MRLNPVALALAFGVAKVAVTIFSILGGAVTMWTIRMPGGPPLTGMYAMLGFRFVAYGVIFGFLGGAIAGALAAVVYNKVIARSA